MKTKEQIIENWLPRYTGVPIEKFTSYILLTNFQAYLEQFAELQDTEVYDRNVAMPAAVGENIVMINTLACMLATTMTQNHIDQISEALARGFKFVKPKVDALMAVEN